MPKLTALYNVYIARGETTDEQKVLTKKAKNALRNTLKENGVFTEDLAYVSKKVPSLAVIFQVYATQDAIQVLRDAHIQSIERIRKSHKKDLL